MGAEWAGAAGHRVGLRPVVRFALRPGRSLLTRGAEGPRSPGSRALARQPGPVPAARSPRWKAARASMGWDRSKPVWNASVTADCFQVIRSSQFFETLKNKTTPRVITYV